MLEGDFILPTVAVPDVYAGIPNNGRVQGLFVHEEEAQIARNYELREGDAQSGRAQISWRNSEWLRVEAERLGVPTLAARPWETVFERALAMLAEGSSQP